MALRHSVQAFVQMVVAMQEVVFTCLKCDADFATPHKRAPYDWSMAQPELQYIAEVISAVRGAPDPATDLALGLHGSYNLIDALKLL
jgi:L-alanine-DL-glutamate epimerase-like enolase superfamily enzyme